MNFLSSNIKGVRAVSKEPWIKGLVLKNNVDFLGVQESLLANPENFELSRVWGNRGFEAEVVGARGNLVD